MGEHDQSAGHPSISCPSCGAALRLELVVSLSGDSRAVTCTACNTHIAWRLSDPDIIDLRPVLDLTEHRADS